MSRRQARSTTVSRSDFAVMPVSARVAWAYLASLAAFVVAGVAVVISNASLSVALCANSAVDSVGDCKLGWAIWIALFAFLIGLIPVALLLKLDWWLIVTMWSFAGLWLATDALDQWWWWTSALLTPAAAALLSADWDKGPQFRSWQRGALILLAAAAAAAMVWWYVGG